MDPAAIDRILACKALPSLPKVALDVLELARDPRSQIEKIASVVQNDPALTVKVLRTVNSSYYGLSKPCPTISRAVAFLGLNTVKSLVLGFSLVDMTGRGTRVGFDLVQYWRRAIYSAAGARILARMTGAWDPEEAFIGALLQDVGMLAAYAALGEEYARLLSAAPEDHAALPMLEQSSLGCDHAAIGARLGERWKLPAQIIECTRDHHMPDSAPAREATLVRLVALASDGAATLTLSEPRRKLAMFVHRSQQWFGIQSDRALSLLGEISDGAARLSSVLEIKTGQPPDIAAILSEANEQLVLQQIEATTTVNRLQIRNEDLARRADTDALTGLGSRGRFDREWASRFAEASQSGAPLSLLFIDVDHFKLVNDAHGHQAGDTVLAEIARRLLSAVAASGIVCRFGGEEFAAILPNVSADQAARLAERTRAAIQAAPIDARAIAPGAASLRCTISVGVASLQGTGGATSPESIVRSADQAVYAAKQAGRNCVRIAPAAPHGSASRPAA